MKTETLLRPNLTYFPKCNGCKMIFSKLYLVGRGRVVHFQGGLSLLIISKMYHLRPSYIWGREYYFVRRFSQIQKTDPKKTSSLHTQLTFVKTYFTTTSKPHLAAPWGWNGPQVVRWTHASRHGWSVRTIFRDCWMMLGGGIKWMSFCSGFTLWVCSFVEFAWISIVDNYFFVPLGDWILP